MFKEISVFVLGSLFSLQPAFSDDESKALCVQRIAWLGRYTYAPGIQALANTSNLPTYLAADFQDPDLLSSDFQTIRHHLPVDTATLVDPWFGVMKVGDQYIIRVRTSPSQILRITRGKSHAPGRFAENSTGKIPILLKLPQPFSVEALKKIKLEDLRPKVHERVFNLLAQRNSNERLTLLVRIRESSHQKHLADTLHRLAPNTSYNVAFQGKSYLAVTMKTSRRNFRQLLQDPRVTDAWENREQSEEEMHEARYRIAINNGLTSRAVEIDWPRSPAFIQRILPKDELANDRHVVKKYLQENGFLKFEITPYLDERFGGSPSRSRRRSPQLELAVP